MARDFTPMEQAGLTKTEFAHVLGVTRVTVHRWVEDGKEPTNYLQKAVDTLLENLAIAVRDGLLPGPLDSLVPSRHTMDERRAVIDAALAKVASA